MDNSITFIIIANCLEAGQIFFLAPFEYDSAHPKKKILLLPKINPGYASENLSNFFWDTL